MTRDAEDGSGREPARPDGPDAFEAIVSGWHREGAVPRWPEGDRDADPLPPLPDPAPQVRAEEEHFVPPEPPPLPRLGPPAVVGLGLLLLGIVLCVAPNVVGVPSAYGLPLGLVALAAGLGWLVLRLWPDPPPRGDGDGEDDGAVL